MVIFKEIELSLQRLYQYYRKQPLSLQLRFFLYIVFIVVTLIPVFLLLLFGSGLLQPDDTRAYWRIIAVLIIFLITALLLCRYVSHKYIIPLLKDINALAKVSPKDRATNIKEINELMDQLSKWNERHKLELQEDQEKIADLEQQYTLIHSDYLQAQHAYDIVQSDYERAKKNNEQLQEKLLWVQGKLNKLIGKKFNDVDWDSYQLFLRNIDSLTAKEHEVFNLYISGLNSKEIQHTIDIKENTLKYHNRNIYNKLGINSRKQLILYATLMQEDKQKFQNDPDGK